MKLIQTHLVRNNINLICWLPQDKRVHVGSVISLEKSNEKWQVLAQYAREESTFIKRGWHNNI